MKLKILGPNKTEATFDLPDQVLRVLFSYETPVAFIREWKDGGMVCRKTSKTWSNTTTRHINSWLPTNHTTVEQFEIDNLLNEVK